MKLTYEEEVELRYLALKGFRYLVRNEIGSTEVFKKKPHREKSPGSGYDTWCERAYPMTPEEIRNRRYTELGKYSFVTWESEPILIEDLLNA